MALPMHGSKKTIRPLQRWQMYSIHFVALSFLFLFSGIIIACGSSSGGVGTPTGGGGGGSSAPVGTTSTPKSIQGTAVPASSSAVLPSGTVRSGVTPLPTAGPGTVAPIPTPIQPTSPALPSPTVRPIPTAPPPTFIPPPTVQPAPTQAPLPTLPPNPTP